MGAEENGTKSIGKDEFVAGRDIPVLDQPQVWADVLFEPSDILEVRCIPPKSLIAMNHPRRFMWRLFWRMHGPYPWVHVRNIQTVIDDLRVVNAEGGVTCWGLYDERAKTWDDVVEIPNVQMNVFCSSNPRVALGKSAAKLARSLFADMENITVDKAQAVIETANLPGPTVLVNSGHGVHAYWRLAELMVDLAAWTAIQKRLISVLHSDEAIHDPGRLLRLPGFTNVNGEPKLAHLVEAYPERRYAVDVFDAALPVLPTYKPQVSDGNATTISLGNTIRPHVVKRALAYQENFAPAGCGQRNSRLFELGAAVVEKFDLNLDELTAVAAKYNSRFAELVGDGEVAQVVENAWKHIQKHGKPRGTALLPNLGPYFEPDEGPLRTLEDWQDEMQQARVDSLARHWCPFGRRA